MYETGLKPVWRQAAEKPRKPGFFESGEESKLSDASAGAGLLKERPKTQRCSPFKQ